MAYVKGRGQRRDRPVTNDMETLKAWCHWKRKQTPSIDQDELDFLKAIEDAISQVGNFKARYETTRDAYDTLRSAFQLSQVAGAQAIRERDAALAQSAALAEAVLSAKVALLDIAEHCKHAEVGGPLELCDCSTAMMLRAEKGRIRLNEALERAGRQRQGDK